MDIEEINILTNTIIGLAIEVHRNLGPGLLESVYQQCLAHELRVHNIQYELEPPLPVMYKGMTIECGLRPDIVVEKNIIIELKAVDKILSIHQAQLMTYLKITGMKLGLLINFNTELLRNGIKRIIL